MTVKSPELARLSRPLDSVDPEIAQVLREEVRRQETGIELIPSENFVSEAVLEAAKHATFEAATRCGKPTRATFVIAMRFML